MPVISPCAIYFSKTYKTLFSLAPYTDHLEVGVRFAYLGNLVLTASGIVEEVA